MKYKTLFRTGLKLLGLYFSITGIAAIVSAVMQIVGVWYQHGNAPGLGYSFYYTAGGFLQLGLGLYLFFDGKWIADKAIPGNRPYCHECGYDVSHAEGRVCSECGTEFSNELLERIAAMPARPERKVL
jgi:hypothetical protein